ncbi:MAG: type II toxin-antitoxin system VapC family toxin [Deltaproteobacteria bacterium]|jgi:tRNA(fMet)-specific endonuclease VapC|nr:type II toxin-antitoxin system VapC family toxin [Deltaproteobacteria bacterium]
MNLPLYSLDKNILSDLVRHPQGVVAKKIAVVGENEICISIIVAAELRFGAAKRNSARLSNQVETILAAMLVVPFDVPTDREYAKLRQLLESSGNSIGANDLLIAAQARANGQILVTNNVREFTKVPSLQVENWLA